MKESTVISSLSSCIIELIHRRSNPTTWIVKRSRRRFLVKRLLSSHWFIDEKQALAFAQSMKLAHEEQLSTALRQNR